MRLIDADALEKQYATKIGEWRGNGILPSMECLMWIAAKDMLDSAPTIDATPVVHGRWQKGDKHISYSIEYYCSVCGDRAPLGYMRQNAKTNYCPNCGAKMDGSDSDGNRQ